MKAYCLILLSLIFIAEAFGQMAEIDLQIRPRYEFRNGYKTLRTENDEPASFISQRSRLGITYLENKMALRLSLQNVSTWGDVPGGTAANKHSTGIFEAYGSFDFNDVLTVKAGRQILSYDNERFFGEVNWTQPARTHDAMLVKIYPYKDHQIHLGGAYNNDSETLFNMPYATDNYKAMEFLWYNYSAKPLNISFLFANVGYEMGLADTTFVTRQQQTFGTYIKWTRNRIAADASFYKQTGERKDKVLDAFYAGATLTYKFSSELALGVGYEYLSGTDESGAADRNHSFAPLFGTNHAFNGHMDYFYVGNHQNTVGLEDLYTKISYEKPRYFFQISPHIFHSAARQLNEDKETMGRHLGAEIDFSASYKLQHNLKLDLGYSQLFGTQSLEKLKGGNSSLSQNWAWLSLTFAPKFTLIK